MSRALFLFPLAIAAPAVAEARFFADIADLPIAPGISEDEDLFAGLLSNDRGRLVLAFAHGAAPPESVTQFYADTLPALGWSNQPAPREEGQVFVRGRERLILHVEPRGGGTYLRARLVVRPASMDAD